MTLTTRFENALAYACIVHAGQVRKHTAIPYISHLLIVAGMALEYGATEDEAIAALLHDAVEDGGGKGRLADIRGRFGDCVADIVDGCSDTDVTPKPPAAERKRRYIEHLNHVQNESVLFVCACDKLANVQSVLKDHRAIGDRVFERFNVDKAGTLGYYAGLADVLTSRCHNPVAGELARAVAELQRIVAVGA